MDSEVTPPPLPPALPHPVAAPESRRPSAPLIVATVLIGLVDLALAIPASAVGSDASNAAYRIGHVVGGMMIVPLLVIALFSIGRRFRNARSQTAILLVVWLLGIVGNLSNLAKLSGESRAKQQESAQAIAEMERQIRDLQRQAATSSMEERIRLAQQARQTMEDTLPKLTSQDRAGLLVSLKIVNPIIEDGSAFAQELVAFQQSPEWDFSTATSQEEIRTRIARIDKLAATCIALHQRITTIETDATRLLKEEPLDPQMKAGLLDGIRESADRKFAILGKSSKHSSVPSRNSRKR